MSSKLRSINVKLQMEFDQFYDPNNEEDSNAELYVMNVLNEMNYVLLNNFPNISPQIFGNNIDRSDIEISESDIEI